MMEACEQYGEGWYLPVLDASHWEVSDPADVVWVNSKVSPQPIKTYQDHLQSAERARAHASIADSRPELVSGIVAIEPNGPPVHDLRLVGAPDWFEDVGVGRAWGLSRTPLTFDPPATDETELCFVRQKAPDGPGLAACWLQAEPARTLPHLHGIPILVVSGEASYHAPYAHATSRFLRQAGVEHDFVRLADLGMRGNGHMMMLERNSLEIASYLQHWIADHVCGKASGPGFR
jgi:hypothetical protein